MIETLTITDFRNHSSSRINAGTARNVIITGQNGSGKTAILEAVSMLGGDRGLRGAQMTDIARFGASGGFSVFANLNDDTQISVFYNSGDSNRRARIDGNSSTLSDLGAQMRIVWLTPREDRLFVESASDRRAFFDRLIASFDSSHSGRVARLSKLLSERAFALKNNADKNWLDALESQIASTAVAIAAARIEYSGNINFFLETNAVSVAGQIEAMILNMGASQSEVEYLEYLSQNRELIGDKMQIDGAHKSDFGVFNKVLEMPVFLTSTGQQKSVLVDLIIAHSKLISARTGKKPIILLDEAAAHMDLENRNRMFAELAQTGAQVWATGADFDIFKNIADSAFVSCIDGRIDNILFSI